MMSNLHINHGWESYSDPYYFKYDIWIESSLHPQSQNLTSITNKSKTKFKSSSYVFDGERVNLDSAFPWVDLYKHSKADDFTALNWEDTFIPKSGLAKKLWEIRKRALANGMKLLSDEEIFNKIDKLRGEYV